MTSDLLIPSPVRRRMYSLVRWSQRSLTTANVALPHSPTATRAAVFTTLLHQARAAAVVQLATERYEGANHTHLTELLSEREDIDLSRPTVRRILTRAGIGSPRSRRIPQHRFRRQRMPQAGTLIQLGGSHHAWLDMKGGEKMYQSGVDAQRKGPD